MSKKKRNKRDTARPMTLREVREHLEKGIPLPPSAQAALREVVETMRRWVPVADLRLLEVPYKKTRNPCYVWAAIKYCTDNHVTYPSWVLEYLAATADAVVQIKPREHSKRVADDLYRALGFARKGSRDPFTRYAAMEKQISARIEFDSMKGTWDERCQCLADCYHVSKSTVENWIKDQRALLDTSV